VKKLRKVMQKARGMTLSELGAESLLRLRRKAATAYQRLVDDIDKSRITDRQLAGALKKLTSAQVANLIRRGDIPHLTAGLADLSDTVACINQHFPESVRQTLCQADAIRKHQILIFNRPLQFEPQIDWHTDMETGVRWPMLHHTQTPVAQGKSSDVRAVWELNRLHHFVTLGRAYALSKDEAYSAEFIDQLSSWWEANPPGFGVNWLVAMEAGIRAVNLIAALSLFRASPKVTDAVIELGLKILLAHGRFIRANLEFSHRLSSNHYLSNLIGLFAIGATMPYLREANAWLRFSVTELLKEMQRQILADGADFEASVNYHRLVLEIYLLFFTLSKPSGVELPAESWAKLEAMFDFVRAYLKPDGEAPLLGDSDDGRLVKFKERTSTEHAYLLSIAAVLFDKAKFRQSPQIDEEAVWWFGAASLKSFANLPLQPTQTSAAFKAAQIFIQRKDSLYLIADCGDHGARGRGSHAHSDALSFELFAYGQTFLRDPGTYVYTASKRWRQLFRSTAYHNAVRIDRQEISEISTDQPFTLGANLLPKINSWQSDELTDVLDAEHYGYQRLPEPVTHRRIITFNKAEGYWLVDDIFTGSGNHLFEWFFNFDTGLTVSLKEEGRVVVGSRTAGLAIVPLANLPFDVKRTCRWVSPSYRTRLPSSGIIYRVRALAPFKNGLLLIPFQSGEEARVVDIGSRFAGKRE
jgi:hypothetical protein